MTTLFDHLPNWAPWLRLLAHLSAGALVGLIYFQTLWWYAQRLVSDGGIVATLASAVGRFGLIGAVLVLASRDGATGLLATMMGIFAARHVVMGRIKVVEQ